MTTFTVPAYVGAQPSGSDVTDTRGYIVAAKIVDVSAGGKKRTVTVPPASHILSIDTLPISSIPASVTQGLTIKFGSSGTANKYGTVSNLSSAQTTGIVASQGASIAGGIIVVEASASVSAADWTNGSLQARILYVTPVT